MLHLLNVGANNKVLITGGAVKISHQHQLLCDRPELLSLVVIVMNNNNNVIFHHGKGMFLCAIRIYS